MPWYHINVTIHLLAAIFWLGGMVFLAAIGARVLRRVEPPPLRAELFRRIGMQFRTFGWVAVGILLMTGVANLYFKGLLHWSVLGDGEFWTSSYGLALVVKLGTVLAMLTLSAAHDFIVGPAASGMDPGSPQTRALRRRSAIVARINAVIGVGLVAAAVVLARGA